jgi:hypothetical protein
MRIMQGQQLKIGFIPDFMAVWVPLILGTLRKPAEHPISAPPGKTGFGIDYNHKTEYYVRQEFKDLNNLPTWLEWQTNASKMQQFEWQIGTTFQVHCRIPEIHLHSSCEHHTGQLFLLPIVA